MDADLAEAQQDAPTPGRTAKAQLRAEARKHQKLIDLPLDGGIIGTGKNLIEDDLSLRVERRLQKQTTGTRHAIRLRDVLNRKGSQAFDFRRLDQVERKIVRHGAAHWNAHQQAVHHQDEHSERRQNAAGGRNRKWTDEVLNNN